MSRDRITREVHIGNITIGGNNPIAIQSMTNTRTKDIEATVKQINELDSLGADIVRVAVIDEEDAKAIKEIKAQTNVPIVADIHFDYRLALAAIDAGVDKLRLNPGNIQNSEHIKEVVLKCKEHNIPIRIGINGGSLAPSLLAKYGSCTKEALLDSMINEINFLEDLDFHNIVLSIKTTNIKTMIEANELIAERFDYPIHVGLTEAGTDISGIIRSSYAIGSLVNHGIGDTIRVSLTGDPQNEIKPAKEILKMCGKYDGVTLISCPTCGRTRYDMMSVINQIQPFLDTIKYPIKIAIMGCVVNGPGEAKDADIGIAGGKSQAVLFKHGIIIKKLEQEEIVPCLKQEIYELISTFKKE